MLVHFQQIRVMLGHRKRRDALNSLPMVKGAINLPLAEVVNFLDPASLRSAMHRIFSGTKTGTGAPPDMLTVVRHSP